MGFGGMGIARVTDPVWHGRDGLPRQRVRLEGKEEAVAKEGIVLDSLTAMLGEEERKKGNGYVVFVQNGYTGQLVNAEVSGMRDEGKKH